MSNETQRWLHGNVLAGFTDLRGVPWWYEGEIDGMETPLYPGAIPVGDVERRLIDWEPIIMPAKVTLSNGVEYTHPNMVHIVRSDTGFILGSPSKSYPLHPYKEWLIDNVGIILDDPDLAISSAVLLQGGAVMSVSIQMNKEPTTTEHGVKYSTFMTWATSFNSTMKTTGMRNNVNILCDNTLAAGFRETSADQKVQIPHRPNAKLNVSEARKTLDVLMQTDEKFEREVEELCRIKMSDRTWDTFVEQMIPLGKDARTASRAQNIRDTWHGMRDNDPRCAPWRDNIWGGFQVANTWLLHNAIAKKKKNGDAPNRFAKNHEMMLGGDIDQHDISVVKRLLRLAEQNSPSSVKYVTANK